MGTISQITSLCLFNVNYPHTWPLPRKMFPFDDVIMWLNEKERKNILPACGWFTLVTLLITFQITLNITVTEARLNSLPIFWLFHLLLRRKQEKFPKLLITDPQCAQPLGFSRRRDSDGETSLREFTRDVSWCLGIKGGYFWPSCTAWELVSLFTLKSVSWLKPTASSANSCHFMEINMQKKMLKLTCAYNMLLR